MSYEPRAAFAGQIAEVSVVELLQTILQGGHTGVARFETPVGAATLWFREGALVDADMGRHHMEGAVARLLALESGTFEVEFKPITRRQVITATTAEMIASAPPRAGTPIAVPQDDNDVSKKRSRRAGVSWHPTGGGRPRAEPSGPVATVRAPTDRPATPPPLPATPVVPLPAGVSVTVVPTTAPVAAVPVATTVPAPSRPPIPAPAPAPAPVPPRAATPASTSARTPVSAHAPTAAAIPAAPPPLGEPMPTPRPVPAAAAPSSPTPAPMDSSPRRTVLGVPMAGQIEPPRQVLSPNEEDRTLMRPGPQAPTMFVPPPGPTEVPTGSSLQLEPRPAQWGTDSMPAVADPPRGSTIMVPVAPPATPPPAAPVPTPPVAAAPAAPAPSGTAIASGRRPAASGEFEPAEPTVLARAPGWTPVGLPPPPANSGQTVVVSPEVGPSQTMTAGSIRRPTPAVAARPGGARRGEDRAAAVAGAIGMGIPPIDRRPVADGARLDQQVEAAGAAGLTGASAPAVVGRYEVLLRIARGGMGTVYLARVTGEGGFRRLFALKVVRDHLSQNDEYVRMLLQEARIASRLHHPNVVGIVDIGTLANQHYLVMDYVEGCTFSELLKVHRRTRPPHLVVPIVLDALMGLHAAHTLVDDDGSPLTLVHCDFSPQNMLVGTNGVCRITDFGIAKATNVINERPSITRGKPAYVSPEQVVGRPLDHRSDIFSAGVVLWNALTGEQLFSGDTPEQTLQSVLNRPVVPPSTVGLRPPSCFDRVCLRALERDPSRRYQSAEQMLIDLRRIAIAEDFLAPSSDVGRWVTETFGRQLELRRQAAGISRGLSSDSQPISVPELGLGEAEMTSETRTLPADYGATPVESHASKTTLLRSDVIPVVNPPAPALEPEGPAIGKALVVIVAVAAATIAIAIAILRPEWIQGTTTDAPALPLDAAAGDTDGADPKADPSRKPDTKGGDAKAGDAKAGDTKADDAKADDAKVGDAKADDAKAGDAKAGAPTATDAKASGATPPPPEVTPPAGDATAKPKKPKKPKKPEPAAEPKAEPPAVFEVPPPPDPGEVLDGPPG